MIRNAPANVSIGAMSRLKSEKKHLQTLADEDLVALAQQGELPAFELIYERHSGPAYSLARRMVGAGALAEDVVQEVFLSVWRSLERYDASRASVRTWLLRIVQRRSIDALRSHSVHARRRVEYEGFEEEEPAREAGIEEVVAQRDEAAGVHSALSTLPGDQRRVIELAYFGGFSQSEIATMIDKPLGTVKGRMRLGMEKLRDVLEAGGIRQAQGMGE